MAIYFLFKKKKITIKRYKTKPKKASDWSEGSVHNVRAGIRAETFSCDKPFWESNKLKCGSGWWCWEKGGGAVPGGVRFAKAGATLQASHGDFERQHMQRDISLIFCWAEAGWTVAALGGSPNLKDLLGSGEELKGCMCHGGCTLSDKRFLSAFMASGTWRGCTVMGEVSPPPSYHHGTGETCYGCKWAKLSQIQVGNLSGQEDKSSEAEHRDQLRYGMVEKHTSDVWNSKNKN